MGVYVFDMEMPAEEYGTMTIKIYPNGHVAEYIGDMGRVWEAVPVPPHGRLIDADSKTFPTPHRNPSNDYMKGWNACLRSVQQQPTVIPAEPAKEE